MYGLPADFTGQAFVGRMLQYVAVFSNQLMFDFDGGCAVTLQSSYSHRESKAGAGVRIFEVPHFEPKLIRLLDKKVTLVSVEQNGTFQMTFENGDRLTLYDTDERYEAYHLSWNGGGLIV